jgi:hypothetical protein
MTSQNGLLDSILQVISDIMINISCPICQGELTTSAMFYKCLCCKTQSLFPRRGEPVGKEQALDNLARVIKNRQYKAQGFERRDNNQDDISLDDTPLEIAVKTVLKDEDLDGVIINVNGSVFPYYLEEAA